MRKSDLERVDLETFVDMTSRPLAFCRHKEEKNNHIFNVTFNGYDMEAFSSVKLKNTPNGRTIMMPQIVFKVFHNYSGSLVYEEIINKNTSMKLDLLLKIRDNLRDVSCNVLPKLRKEIK